MFVIVVPVLDVWQGRVVRGVAGRRDDYRPLVSRITSSTEPLQVAHDLHQRFGFSHLYLADLDAIRHRQPHDGLYSTLASRGATLWVDAGIDHADAVERVLATGAQTAIVGLESCPSPELLPQLIQRFGSERLLFSLDLQGGVPLGSGDWRPLDAVQIADVALAAGFTRLLVLDLSDVGTNTGGATDDLLRTVRRRAPHVHLAAGGGVRHVADLRRLAALGVEAVLVASALHDERLTPHELQTLG